MAATEAGVPVSTIAYGTAAGVIENQGRTIPVPVDEETLAELAERPGGQAYTAATGDELTEVYEDIGSSIGWRTEAARADALPRGLRAAPHDGRRRDVPRAGSPACPDERTTP